VWWITFLLNGQSWGVLMSDSSRDDACFSAGQFANEMGPGELKFVAIEHREIKLRNK
jgi:hypothetical protein